ncbi:hypothetical protein [Anoxybacillus flavithermus]|uniref:hypothetical protein n=1 Tax=Anoxybacillus flavithermus TaxID=33934 RepID=UPI0018674683|nr:hypothetical protein [Anoxybacillus flavithermus]MBE2941656.1 hypothetical protein [Anoxybacillus flavithermus]MBE2955239.1 hypothetical protein [Anoxybacillus flavithermus]
MNKMKTAEFITGFENTQILPEDEAKELQILQQKFIESYINHKDKVTIHSDSSM